MEKISLEMLPTFANTVLATLSASLPRPRATIVALCGELGAGKTTFTQALARVLGVAESLQSPTYVLMKTYATTHPAFAVLVHIDAYRLEKPEEFTALKPEAFLSDPHTLVIVEWPEKAGNLLPEPDMVIQFFSEGAGEWERYLSIEK